MNEKPCPYPGCGDVRGHPRPHLMEAAFIEKRIAEARDSEEGELGRAWREAEAALPVKGRIACQRRPEEGPYEAWAQSEGGGRKALGYGYGDSPVEALRSLTEKLGAVEPTEPEVVA